MTTAMYNKFFGFTSGYFFSRPFVVPKLDL